MNINFQQGLISYPATGLTQTFLIAGGYVSLSTTNGPVNITFAQRTQNYLFTENNSVSNAWGPITPSTNTWLYWDLNPQTAVRTFGITTVQPIAQTAQPGSPVEDLHWFNTSTKIMYVYTSGFFRPVIRVFAAKFLSPSTFTPLGTGFPLSPFAGTQVGLSGTPVSVGQILVDSAGKPIRRSDGSFFTTNDLFFVSGSPTTPISLEASTTTGIAQTNIAGYTVVKFSSFGQIIPATYNDLQSATVAMLLEDVTTYNIGAVTLQGLIVNPYWNWTTAGAQLWIDNTGALVDVDPHISDAITYPIGKAPCARVVSQTSVIFQQGLGGKGDQGLPGTSAASTAATVSALGVVQTSVPAAIPSAPVVVGDNDPRIVNAINRTGDTMTGNLALSGNKITGLAVATTSGDAVRYNEFIGKVSKTGDSLTGTLTFDTIHTITGLSSPVNSSDAATKAYVDAITASLNVHPAVDYLADSTNAQITGATPSSGTIDQNGGLGIGAALTAATANVPLVVDGQTVNLGERILVNMNTPTGSIYNGIYTLTIVASPGIKWRLTRAIDDNDSIINQVTPGDFVYVSEGNTYVNTGWVESALGTGGPGQPNNHVPGASDDSIVIGTDVVVYTQFSGAGVYVAGTGLTLLGNTFSLDQTHTDTLYVGLSSVTGLLKGTGVTVVAATSGTDYSAGTSGLSTGIVKSTTGTGNLTIAAAGDFPTLNQNTTGSAATLTTTRNINITPFNGSADIIIAGTTINAQVGTTYTFVLTDAGKVCTFANVSPVAVTVPSNSSVAFTVGTQIELAQAGTGKVTFSPGIGVTINSQSGNLSLTAQYAGATLVKTATDIWLLLGNLSA